MTRPKPLVLIILDGWGYRAETKANAIALARKPIYDRLLREYPNTLIQTSGKYVGLPDGQMGNSEVGHLNIGAGRIVHMDSTRIELMIQNGEFFSHPVLTAAMKNARYGRTAVAPVWFGFRWRRAFLSIASPCAVEDGQAERSRACVRPRFHGWARHVAHQRRWIPRTAAAENPRVQHGKNRQREWPLLCHGPRPPLGAHGQSLQRHGLWRGEGGKYVDPVQGVKDSYNKDVTDEFIVPFVCVDNRGEPLTTIRDEDSCICFNFRADRVRQITRALARNSGLNDQGGTRLAGCGGP